MSWSQTSGGRPYHLGNLRSLLLDEARRILVTSGPGKLNLRTLAGRVGIAPGSVYHHYASKHALLASLAAEGFGDLERALTAAAEADPSTPIRASALAYFDFARRLTPLYGLMFDPLVLAEPEVGAARDRAFNVLRSAIGAAASQQDRAPDTVLKIALAVWACGHGAATMTLADPEGQQGQLMEDVIQGLEALFRRR